MVFEAVLVAWNVDIGVLVTYPGSIKTVEVFNTIINIRYKKISG